MKAYTKTQLAIFADVSPRTFSRWLIAHEKALSRFGVTKKTHILPPNAVKYICDHFGIDIN